MKENINYEDIPKDILDSVPDHILEEALLQANKVGKKMTKLIEFVDKEDYSQQEIIIVFSSVIGIICASLEKNKVTSFDESKRIIKAAIENFYYRSKDYDI